MSHIAIRPGRPDDAGAILGMIHELARFERAADAVKATEADLLRDGWGPEPKFQSLIATLDGEPVGFALFFHNYSTWEGRAGLFLEDLYVMERARGLGVGRRLMSALAALAVARGYARLDLNVLDWNPARDFYAAIGMVQLAEWQPYRLTGAALRSLAAEGADEAASVVMS